MSMWPATLSVKVVSKLSLDFHVYFQVPWLTPLLRCCLKVLLEKAIQSLRVS